MEVIKINDINDFQLTDNFNLKEFECTHPLHSHVRVSKELVNKLQELRTILGRPVIINSAYRCEERNRQVGGSPNSQHLDGRAADITLDNQEKSIEEIAEIAEEIGFKGIGYYYTFIHLDVRNLVATTWDGRD